MRSPKGFRILKRRLRATGEARRALVTLCVHNKGHVVRSLLDVTPFLQSDAEEGPCCRLTNGLRSRLSPVASLCLATLLITRKRAVRFVKTQHNLMD